MKFIYNNVKLKSLRKELRRNQTDAERLLWSRLRNKQIRGFKFYRQFSVGFCILDFYCPKLRFAIELDGGHHNEEAQILLDENRGKYIKSNNIKILRIWNSDLIANIDMGWLMKLLHSLMITPPNLPL